LTGQHQDFGSEDNQQGENEEGDAPDIEPFFFMGDHHLGLLLLRAFVLLNLSFVQVNGF
jgi:hypothetical protein